MPPAPPPSRRWFQFSLATLILLMVIAALVAVIWRDRLGQAQLEVEIARLQAQIARLQAQIADREMKVRYQQENAEAFRLELRKLQGKLEGAGPSKGTPPAQQH